MSLLPRGRWAPAIHEQLEAMLSEPGQGRVAAFDFDQTCIFGDIGESILAAVDPDAMARYLELDEREGHEVSYPYCAAALGGRPLAELREIVAAQTHRALQSQLVVPRTEIAMLQAAMRLRGWDVWVVTASARWAVLPLAERFGVPADRVLGMQLRRSEDDWIHQEVIGTITYRQGKVDALLAATGKTPDFAAGDSITDLEMLRSATWRLLLDRGAPYVRDIAQEEGWWIQAAFERTSPASC